MNHYKVVIQRRCLEGGVKLTSEEIADDLEAQDVTFNTDGTIVFRDEKFKPLRAYAAGAWREVRRSEP